MKGIQLTDVSFAYIGGEPALANVSLAIAPGSFVGITGANGSGKSTLTYLFNGLIPHTIAGSLSGDIRVAGVSTKDKSVGYFASRVGMVFQNPDFSLFNLTVEEEIGFGLRHLKKSHDVKTIGRALKLVGLEGFESRDPQMLSYGQKQKVCLASVLALDVSTIVLDEPTAMLDWKSSVDLYEMLTKLHRQGKTIIVVEHDTDFLWKYTKHAVVLDHGSVVAYGKTQTALGDRKRLTKLGVKIPHPISV